MKRYIVLWNENKTREYRVFLDANDNFIVAEKFYNNLVEKQKIDSSINSINFFELVQL